MLISADWCLQSDGMPDSCMSSSGGPQFPYTLDLANLRGGAGGLCDTPLYRGWPDAAKRCTV